MLSRLFIPGSQLSKHNASPIPRMSRHFQTRGNIRRNREKHVEKVASPEVVEFKAEETSEESANNNSIKWHLLRVIKLMALGFVGAAGTLAAFDYIRFMYGVENGSRCLTYINLNRQHEEVTKWEGVTKLKEDEKRVKERYPKKDGIAYFGIDRLRIDHKNALRDPKASVQAVAKVILPGTSMNDHGKICQWLAERGVVAEESEAGVKQGLIDYMLNTLNRGMHIHTEMRCKCDYGKTLEAPEDPSKTHIQRAKRTRESQNTSTIADEDAPSAPAEEFKSSF